MKSARHQTGLTLIELMISAALGLAVMAAIAGFFGPVSSNRREVENTARMFDNAAYGLEVLGNELRGAGFYAELPRTAMTLQPVDPCNTANNALGFAAPGNAPVAVQGVEGSAAAPLCITNRLAGTDIITIRRVDFLPVTAASVTAAGAPFPPFLQVSKCVNDPVATPFVITDATANFPLRNRDCTTVAEVRRVLVRTYYVRCAGGCPAGAIPSLVRAELVTDPVLGNRIVETALVDGIENLQIEYGFDTDNDGNPDIYRTTVSGVAGAADNDWSNVMAVRVYVVARADQSTPGYVDQKTFSLGLAGTTAAVGDNFKRHVTTTVVRLMNPSIVRERP